VLLKSHRWEFLMSNQAQGKCYPTKEVAAMMLPKPVSESTVRGYKQKYAEDLVKDIHFLVDGKTVFWLPEGVRYICEHEGKPIPDEVKDLEATPNFDEPTQAYQDPTELEQTMAAALGPLAEAIGAETARACMPLLQEYYNRGAITEILRLLPTLIRFPNPRQSAKKALTDSGFYELSDPNAGAGLPSVPISRGAFPAAVIAGSGEKK
jgi:hypothetical protein